MRKSIEDFNFEHQPSLPHSTVAHLGMGSYLAAGSNVVLLGPPGVGNYVELGVMWSCKLPALLIHSF